VDKGNIGLLRGMDYIGQIVTNDDSYYNANVILIRLTGGTNDGLPTLVRISFHYLIYTFVAARTGVCLRLFFFLVKRMA
jgi:hypothetical protein